MQEMQVQSLGWEDFLEKEIASHSGILAWRIPWTEEPGGYSPQSGEKQDTTEVTWHVQKDLRQHTRVKQKRLPNGPHSGCAS